jgi:hypothetical protein
MEVRWNRHPYWMGAVAVGMTIATGDERGGDVVMCDVELWSGGVVEKGEERGRVETGREGERWAADESGQVRPSQVKSGRRPREERRGLTGVGKRRGEEESQARGKRRVMEEGGGSGRAMRGRREKTRRPLGWVYDYYACCV